MEAAPLDGTLLAHVKHRRIDVAHGQRDRQLVGAVFPSFVKDPEGDVARASSHIETLERLTADDLALRVQNFARLEWTNLADEIILPEAVNADGHGIVHQVVAVSHVGEHLGHLLLLLVVVYLFEAEVDLLALLLRELTTAAQQMCSPDGV